jgi:hypothetical protein
MQGVNMADGPPTQHATLGPLPAQEQQQQQQPRPTRRRVSWPPDGQLEDVRYFHKSEDEDDTADQQQQPFDPATCSSGYLGHMQHVFLGGKPLWLLMPSGERLLEQLRKQGLQGLSMHPEPAAFKDYERKAEVGSQGHG